MAKMFNRARMTVTSTGTGALSLGVAVAGYQTFSSAGAQNGDSVSYAVEDGLKWEIGTGTYNSVAGTLSRTVTQSFDGTTYGTSAISVTTSAQVFISPLAADLQYGTSAGNLVQLDGSARLPAVDGSLVTALNASNISSGTIAAARVPTLNQNTTGTAANVTGTVAVANGGTGLTSLTAGYIPFGGSTTYSSDSNLFWDNTNKRLGIGITTPAYTLDVTGNARFTSTVLAANFTAASSGPSVGANDTSGTNGATFNLYQNGTAKFAFGTGGGATPAFFLYNNASTYNTINLTQAGVLTIGDASYTAFNTAGTERMRIASNGNIGIGTTSPSYSLDVNGAIRVGDAGQYQIYLNGSSATRGSNISTSAGSSTFYNGLFLNCNGYGTGDNGAQLNTGLPSWRLAIGSGSSEWAGSDVFAVGRVAAGGTYTSPSVLLKLDASGNLGLGVTPSAWSAYKVFEIGELGAAIAAGGNNTTLTYNAYYNSGWKYARSSNKAAYFQIDSGQHIWWNTNSTGTAGSAITFTQAMTLDASGRLGTGGVTSPAGGIDIGNTNNALVIRNSGATTGYAYGQISNTNGIALWGVSSSTGTFWSSGGAANAANFGTSLATPIVFATSDTERMRIDSSGNVGIGLTNPSAWGKVGVQTSGGTEAALNLFSPSATNGAKLVLSDNNYNATINTVPSGGSTDLSFTVSGTQSLYIKAVGNVGIGTSSPSGKLQTSGSGSQQVEFTSTDNQVALKLTAGGSGGSWGLVSDNGSAALRFYSYTASTERARIDSNGSLLVGLTSTLDSNSKAQFQNLGTSKNAYYAINNDAATNNSICWNQATSGDNRFIAFVTETSYTERGRLYYDRAAGQTKLAATSDQRLKKDISDAPSLLDAVNNIKVRQYAWKETGNVNIGFIAQELIDVVPRAVSEGQDAEDGSIKSPWCVDGVTLVPYLTKAIQELAAKVQALEAKVA